ncbi:CPBP family intramembrane metalloprotease [Candidatus Saccharibacteria bacterium]|nr:CPBP family intramembrane metalloprotease [Candidatus Saccharibacteria bacterium]
MKFLKVVGVSAFVFAVVVGVEFLISLPMALWMPKDILESPITNTIYTIISYILAIIFIIYLPPKIFKKKISPSSRESLGLSGLPTWTDIGLAPVGYVVSILIAMGLTALFNLIPWFDANQAQELGYSIYMTGVERGIAFVMLAVVAPIAEEIVFRGFLYGKLRVMIPKWLAILITSFLFGLVHLQWNVGITVFAMSIVTCSLREITGTIYAGTLVHIINNGVAFYLVYVAGIM